MTTRTSTTNMLALHGGTPVVTVAPAERWQPPVEREIELVTGLIRDRYLSAAGKGFAKQFEDEFASWLGVKHCAAQSSGTSALQAAMFSVGVGPGDEVICPSHTWISSISPAIHLGARPVFCEIDPQTLVLDPADVARRISPRTRCIVAVHLWGNPADMDALLALGQQHSVAVIEDCSHAHGATYRGRKVGSIGAVGCFSMQGGSPGGKAVGAGEGGLIVTSDDHLCERILAYGHFNRAGLEDELISPEYKALGHLALGLKFRAHPLALAIAKASFETLEERNARIAANRQRLFDALAELPGITPVQTYAGAQLGGFYGGLKAIYYPQVFGGLPVERFVAAANAEGAKLSAGPYELLHLIPLFAQGFDFYGGGRGPLTGDYPGYRPGDLPVTEDVHPRILSLPALIDPSPGYIDQYADALAKVADHAYDLL